MAVREQDKRLGFVIHAPRQVEPQYLRCGLAGKQAGVVGLGHVPEVVERPAGEAPTPVVVALREGEAGKVFVEHDSVGEQGLLREGGGQFYNGILAGEGHVDGRLASVAEGRIAEGLFPQAVDLPDRRAGVLIEANVHAVVGFVRSRGQDLPYRHLFTRCQFFEGRFRDATLIEIGGGEGKGRPCLRVPCGSLDEKREKHVRIDPQGPQESRAEFGTGIRS